MNNITTFKMSLAIVSVVSLALVWNYSSHVDGQFSNWFSNSRLQSQQQQRGPNNRDLETIKIQSVLSTTDNGYFDQVLKEILIPRVPGTPGQVKVKNFIASEMNQLGWTIQEDAFQSSTPQGVKPFYNIIATLNPKACKRLVMSCHFDSKYSTSGRFVGATDSAVPCSMLLQIANDLNKLLQTHKQRNSDITLQFMFFDGEEAFDTWSSTDSLYGSRHLAELLQKTQVDPNGPCQGQRSVITELDRIQELVLLDLLGAKKPSFYSFFPDTDHLYASLLKNEAKLNQLGLIDLTSTTGLRRSSTNYFKNQRSFGMIEDDHVPFMRKGVKILHIITSPFPSVWHKDSDNYNNLDFPTIRNLVKLFKVFVNDYFNLTPS